VGVNPRLVLTRLRRLAGEHKLFTGALAVGALLRLLTSIGYPGALWFAGDSYVYVGAALRPQPNLSKATGYSFFLRLLLPFHSFTLVTGVQHVMGLLIAVMIYVLLRRNGVSKTWSAIATLPQLLDGYIIEDEHLIMAETVFTFLLMIALLMLLWRPRTRWWTAGVAGLLVGSSMAVRTEGEVLLVVLPLFLLLRGWSWKTLRGWGVAIVFTVAMLVPFGAYTSWFHARTSHQGYQTPIYSATLSTGFYLWGRVSSFADCAVINPTGDEAKVCPTQPIVDRDPPGNYIWHAPYVHANMDAICTVSMKDGKPVKKDGKPVQSCGPVSPAGNKLLTDFAIKAVLAQPFDYAKTVVKDVMLSFGFPRIGYPGSGTTYYYNFHFQYVGKDSHTGKPISLLPPNNPAHEWIPGGTAYSDWLSYGHQAPGVVHKVAAAPIAVYQRVVFTWGPLLAIIFLVGLGGVFSVTGRRQGKGVKSVVSAATLTSLRLHWRPRGTSMLPWVIAATLLVAPIAVADFDYRYLIPVIPFACLAAGLAFAPRRTAPVTRPPSAPDSVESTVPDQVA
jgi:hypothetical protein